MFPQRLDQKTCCGLLGRTVIDGVNKGRLAGRDTPTDEKGNDGRIIQELCAAT